MLLPKLILATPIAEPSYIDNYKFQDYKIGLDFIFLYFFEKNAEAWN
jgi:hypothetical protein